MWLLSTDRAELHFFASPTAVKDGFAALSHVWDKEEQSFQDVRSIQQKYSRKGKNPREYVCSKIRNCCKLAERQGYKWVWIDTCCIDKTSSAELSEAINSMYAYYSVARICYAYMRDVSSREDTYEYYTPSTIHMSVWFNRGWTLQELIAPRFLLFVSHSWRTLGTKADFAGLLGSMLPIPAPVLRLEVSHTRYSIAQRMSWFGDRKTTRVEDEAYCLLGLFDIQMPPLYGEGTNAFQRLQEEIMKHSADTTLFAWDGGAQNFGERSCLFAPSPSAFLGLPMVYIPLHRSRQLRSRQHTDPTLSSDGRSADDMTFSVTAHGILAYIPIIVRKNKTYADLFWSCDDDDKSRRGRRYLLCLDKDPSGQAARSSRRPAYVVSTDGERTTWVESPRRPGEYVIEGHTRRASWQTILIRQRLPEHHHVGMSPVPLELMHPNLDVVVLPSMLIPPMPMQLAFDAPFRFPEDRIEAFAEEIMTQWIQVSNAGGEKPWQAHLPTTWAFTCLRPVVLLIRIGKCYQQRTAHGSARPIWATLRGIPLSECPKIPSDDPDVVYADLGRTDDPAHDCRRDHVSRWSGYRKTFDLDACDMGPVTLSFTRCRINPEGTLVLKASHEYRPPARVRRS